MYQGARLVADRAAGRSLVDAERRPHHAADLQRSAFELVLHRLRRPRMMKRGVGA